MSTQFMVLLLLIFALLKSVHVCQLVQGMLWCGIDHSTHLQRGVPMDWCTEEVIPSFRASVHGLYDDVYPESTRRWSCVPYACRYVIDAGCFMLMLRFQGTSSPRTSMSSSKESFDSCFVSLPTSTTITMKSFYTWRKRLISTRWLHISCALPWNTIC